MARKKLDTRSKIARAIDERQAAIRLDWAKRHPARAREERTLRKARAATIAAWKHKNEGTIETHARTAADARRHQDGPLARLHRSGAIDAHQLQAGAEIAAIAERIGADVAVRTASLETRVQTGRRPDGAERETLARVRGEVAYTRWRTATGRDAAAVLDMLVGEPVGFTIAAARHGMHHRRARRILIEALDRWLAMLGAACREIDDGDVARAEARIAA